MLVSVKSLTKRFYYGQPDWVDGTSRFGALIRKRLRPGFRMLDLGAGAGKAGPINFRGEVRKVVGVDSDSYIEENPSIDHRVLGRAEELPFRAGSFDLIVCDWVVEHLARVEDMASEVWRVLRSGGIFALRTGNVRHYSYAIAAATPYWFHRLAANKVRGLSEDNADPHATYYRMNTRRAIRRCLGRAGFVEDEVVMVEPEPSYLMFSVPSFLVGVAYERIVNRAQFLSGFRACIMGCFRKP